MCITAYTMFADNDRIKKTIAAISSHHIYYVPIFIRMHAVKYDAHLLLSDYFRKKLNRITRCHN